MENRTGDLLRYIAASPTAFHAVDSAAKLLRKAGFTELQEGESWTLEKGKGYFVTRNLSSLLAFRVPEGESVGFQLAAGHTDSPCYKIKEKGIVACGGKYGMLDTEMYGGAIAMSWLDRPLSVAGRLMVKDDQGVHPVLINIEEDTLVIPNLCIHQHRGVNNGVPLKGQTDMLPMYSLNGGKNIHSQAAEYAGVSPESVLASDLFVYNRMPGSVWGSEKEFISAPRLDDLECAYSAVMALIEAENVKNIAVSCLFDNEEVGSWTRQGAVSSFLADTLTRIDRALGFTGEEHSRRLASSFMLSADNAHAAHPNHPETSDPVNRVWMNEGIVVKFSGNQKYTSDSVSASVFRSICEKAGVPTQTFFNHSDQAGGSTLGNLSGRHVSLTTVDIGLAQLAMHSSWETAGAKDAEWMVQGMRAFFETRLESRTDCVWTMN
ncbi:MAG: M18 family aminopeptidase [Candidatus Faecivivens sp.]|nr:M18 family aminopeptidase [Candidatus Faecivivens sp.]